jgi:hypothetical protein
MILYGFLFLCLICLIALVLRFILPEVIYVFRQEIVQVKITKAFLDTREGRNVPKEYFTKLLGMDIRRETTLNYHEYVSRRVDKIRELYHIYSAPAIEFSELEKKGSPQTCIIESANLLENLAEHLELLNQGSIKIIDASAILTWICSQNLETSPSQQERDVSVLLSQKPMSIEQITEIIIAAILGLEYRLHAQDNQIRN